MKTLYRSDKHWNQYRIQSARAPWWDYGKNGVYYVTICTKHRFPFFGEVQDGQMRLSKIGELVKQLWMTLPEMSLPGVKIETLAISPNHLHGIIILDRAVEPIKETTLPVGSPTSEDEAERKAFFQRISPKKGSLPHLIRKFKGLVTKAAREQDWLGKNIALWQPSYYDRVVRNTSELERIAEHLSNEVYHWEARQDDYIHTPEQQKKKQSQHRRVRTLKMLYQKRRGDVAIIGQMIFYKVGRKFRMALDDWLRHRFPHLYAPLDVAFIPIWKR